MAKDIKFRHDAMIIVNGRLFIKKKKDGRPKLLSIQNIG